MLSQYFEPRKAQFRAPEYRKVVVVAVIPAERARWIEISDEDLKRAYEERKVRLTTPERRQIQQMVFPKADDARAASERIAKGETFEAIAKELRAVKLGCAIVRPSPRSAASPKRTSTSAL